MDLMVENDSPKWGLLYLWLCGEKARKVYKRAFFIYFIE
jgi:hypothetical protein